MAEQSFVRRDGAPARSRLPGSSFGGQSDLAKNEVDDAVENAVLVGDVVIQ